MRRMRILIACMVALTSVAFAPAAESGSKSALPTIGVAGDLPLPDLPDAKVVALDESDLKKGKLKGYDELVLDAESFDAIRGKKDVEKALSQYARHRPLTVVGVDPAELGLAGRADVTSGPGGLVAVTTVLAGSTRFDQIHRWADPELADPVTSAHDWWNSIRVKYASEIATKSEVYSSSLWSLRYSTTYSYTAYPYGTIGYAADWYLNIADSGSYDFWSVVIDTRTNPGVNIWGTPWRTSTTWLLSDTDYFRYDHLLTMWAPGTHVELDWISWSLGTWAGQHGATTNAFMWNSYPSAFTVDTYQSSSNAFGDSYFFLRHDFDYGSTYASTLYQSEPGMIVRVPNGVCVKFPYTNKAEWRDYSTGSFQTTWIDSWREVCP